ncbi:unnamed protein product [Staurois parvus]|uniref:Uncharacterized protein n=1 Tax=Staurois parvus TaxID=386267 RepID=A0ABN9CDJ2_9NEOB|nr:unnamed protein product [Staurois parvus]
MRGPGETRYSECRGRGDQIVVNAGSGERPDIVNAGSGETRYVVNAGSGETRYNECRVRGDQYSECKVLGDQI